MKKYAAMAVITLLLTALACSVAWSQTARDVKIGSFLLLRVRVPAGGYSINERAVALQNRANDLLKGGKQSIGVSVKPAGHDVNIYADGHFFMTVGPGDAKANRTTPEKLAKMWAERIRVIYLQATPNKPGVGNPVPPKD